MSISVILAVVGLVLTVMGLIVPLFYGIPCCIALVSWIAGLVIGIMDAKKGKGLGVAGAIVCGIFLGISVLLLLIALVLAGAIIGAFGVATSSLRGILSFI